ncbi:MAG TPA: sensor histidine kinase, partial [Rhodothermales bacterium]|nr:sensor histidine kinase [Rhodothermales bacterium]
MLPAWVTLLIAMLYLALLFAIAWWGDRRAEQGRSIVGNAYGYALSLAVYCTAWTFYGSVGRAASEGIGFLPIFVGPTLMMPLSWLILRKMIRISKRYRITSIADFVASRYGKSATLGGIITIIAVLGGIPYIALQLKAISYSFLIITGTTDTGGQTAFYVAFTLALFAILFGTRHLNPLERHEGMVAAITFESIVKLLTFLLVGGFVTYGMFDGYADIFTRAEGIPALENLFRFEPAAYSDLMWMTILSGLVVVLLPRQFHMAVVENVSEAHISKAMWLFPLYLLLINLFVLPIALGGRIYFGNTQAADGFVLALPIAADQSFISVLTFLGGLSAATGMVIVATITLSTMVSNDLIVPTLLRLRKLDIGDRMVVPRFLLLIRRTAIIGIIALGYGYFKLVPTSYTLVNLGLISFAAIAQFAPAVFGGLFWKQATKLGAMSGVLAGSCIWGVTLLIPSLAESGWVSNSVITDGYFGLTWLRPYALFGQTDYSSLSHSLFWSFLFNIVAFVGVSLFTKQSFEEQKQAFAFVDVFKQKQALPGVAWKGQARAEDLENLLKRFLGRRRSTELLTRFHQQVKLALGTNHSSELAELVQFTETQLSAVIGSASARVMVASVVKEGPLAIEELMHMLDETRQVIQYSRELEEKSRALELASAESRKANDQLKELDKMKDDFVSTVTHELRTPLTSIRALTEIILLNEGLPVEQRKEFLQLIIRESERLTRLINDVLDMEKTESDSVEWLISEFEVMPVIEEATRSLQALAAQKKVGILLVPPEFPIMLQADRDRLIQVLVNLLSNALKFSDDTGSSIYVSVRK